MLELNFVLDSEKKHSVKYKHKESDMTIYVPNNLISHLDSGDEPIPAPRNVKVTLEAK